MQHTLLIFDDDTDILSICTFIFERMGWKVASFDNCNNITEKVRQYMPDVILMDNWIPDQGGINATQTLKADPGLKHIPVVYFSANRDVESLAAEAGADNYIKKPFDLKDFEHIVTQYATKEKSGKG